MNSENTKMIGEIEVILEDKDGNIKRREKKRNTITGAFLRHAFYDALNIGANSALLRSNIRTNFNYIDRVAPTSMGIYCLSTPINVGSDTYEAPYVDESTVTLRNVSFYNIAGNATETARTMIPMDARCYYDQVKNQFTVEYVKNTSAGVINSVCIGRDFATMALYNVAVKDSAMLPELLTGTTNYVLEFTGDSTTIYRTATATSQMSFNFKTKESKSYAVAALNTNIAGQFGGIVIGNNLYKVVKTSAAAGEHVATLSYIEDWKTSTTVLTKVINIPARPGSTLDVVSTPVLVARPDKNELEVFVTTSVGSHGADGYGCNIQKAVINLYNMSYTIKDLGIFKYGISSSTTATIGQYKTGCYFEGKYYLPYWNVSTGSSTIAEGTAAFQSGVITSDFEKADGFVNFQSAAAVGNMPVITDTGVKMCRATVAASPYVYASQILSGANLAEPVIKTEYDLLRVIYRYTLV